MTEAITRRETIKKVLKDIYGEKPDQKSGKWLFKQFTPDGHIIGQCSECKQRKRIDNYCPNCGAKMGGMSKCRTV